MAADAPSPALFVARDRARRFSRYLREALRERKLHYRGAEVGMASLVDEADEALGAVLEDARGTRADVLAQRLHDRERGYMELPLAVVVDGLLDRVDLARRMDRARGTGAVPEREARAAVLALLDDALRRLDAFCAAYDEKRPLPPPRRTDLGHALAQVERDAAWQRGLAGEGVPAEPACDRLPPDVRSDPSALEDLLRAARAAVPAAPGPWRVTPSGPGRPLELALGAAPPGAAAVEPPERLARAAEVLRFLHPVEVACRGHAPAPQGGLLSPGPTAEPRVEEVRLGLPDEAAGDVERDLARAAGPEAHLDPEQEKAVRALLEAPPLPPAGPAPPARLVALLGVLRALDQALRERVLARASTGAVRVAASRLPRERTRKAPLLRSLLAQLEARFKAFPTHRAAEVAEAAAQGKLAARHATAADVAALLALLGRPWNAAGVPVERALDLAPLEDAEVEALVGDLCALAAVRRDLEAGRTVEAPRMARLEKAALGVLGRLGRVPPPAA